MLEQPLLLLRRWHAQVPGRSLVLNPRSLAPLGFVCRCVPNGLLARLCWWRSCLAVHESEDEPLLLTIEPALGLSPTWLVREAEGHVVGRIRGRSLVDIAGLPLAGLRATARSGVSVYQSPDGVDLAAVERDEEGVRLGFRPGTADNPFVRMVLLSAALVHHQDVLSATNSPCRPASASLPSRTS